MRELTLSLDTTDILVLKEDTKINIRGDVICRAIHCIEGCNSLMIFGSGNLTLCPTDEDYVAIGRPPRSCKYEGVKELRKEPLYINISCAEVLFRTNNRVQWLGNYGSNNVDDIVVTSNVLNEENWKDRRAAFAVLEDKYIASRYIRSKKCFQMKFPTYQIDYYSLMGKFFADAGIRTALFNNMILSGEEYISRRLPMVIAKTLIYNRKFVDDYNYSLEDDLLRVQRIVAYIRCMYDKFYGKRLSMDILLGCFRLCREYEKQYFSSVSNYDLSGKLAWATLHDTYQYNLFGQAEVITEILSGEFDKDLEGLREYSYWIEHVELTEDLKAAIKVVVMLGGDWN